MCYNISYQKCESRRTLLSQDNQKLQASTEFGFETGKYNPNRKLNITSNSIQVTGSNGAWTNIDWNRIKEIKLSESKYFVELVSEDTWEGKPIFINITIIDSNLLPKWKKAMEHMAALKGAKLIKDDLFGGDD